MTVIPMAAACVMPRDRDRSPIWVPHTHRPILTAARAPRIEFGADLHLVDWLVEMGYRFDVVTDLEVHRDGVDRLNEYQVVLTGSHPEYTSIEMLDAYQAFLNGGGRMMYLGGNGMWWVTQLDPDTGTGIEVRRRSSPMWQWPAQPGEAHLSTTGEPAGTWASRGRPVQSLLGIGYVGEGYGPGRPYRRRAGGFDPRAAFIFEGLRDEDLIGDIPSLVNSWGAAGFEVDFADAGWGTPEHTLVLATADGFVDFAIGGDLMIGGAAQHPSVHSDMVLLDYPNGGAVFGTGSMTWCACLSHNDYDNTVSRVTRNVLDGFRTDRVPGRAGASNSEDA